MSSLHIATDITIIIDGNNLVLKSYISTENNWGMIGKFGAADVYVSKLLSGDVTHIVLRILDLVKEEL